MEDNDVLFLHTIKNENHQAITSGYIEPQPALDSIIVESMGEDALAYYTNLQITVANVAPFFDQDILKIKDASMQADELFCRYVEQIFTRDNVYEYMTKLYVNIVKYRFGITFRPDITIREMLVFLKHLYTIYTSNLDTIDEAIQILNSDDGIKDKLLGLANLGASVSDEILLYDDDTDPMFEEVLSPVEDILLEKLRIQKVVKELEEHDSWLDLVVASATREYETHHLQHSPILLMHQELFTATDMDDVVNILFKLLKNRVPDGVITSLEISRAVFRALATSLSSWLWFEYRDRDMPQIDFREVLHRLYRQMGEIYGADELFSVVLNQSYDSDLFNRYYAIIRRVHEECGLFLKSLTPRTVS